MISLDVLTDFFKSIGYNWSGEVALVERGATEYFFLPAKHVGISRLCADSNYCYKMLDDEFCDSYKLIILSHSDFVIYNFSIGANQYTHLEGDFSEDWILFQARHSNKSMQELVSHFNYLNSESNAQYDHEINETKKQIAELKKHLTNLYREKTKTNLAFTNTMEILNRKGLYPSQNSTKPDESTIED